MAIEIVVFARQKGRNPFDAALPERLTLVVSARASVAQTDEQWQL